MPRPWKTANRRHDAGNKQGHQNKNRLIKIVDERFAPGSSVVAQTLAIAYHDQRIFWRD